MDRQILLDNISFGERVAEHEKDQLRRYFSTTVSWTKLWKGEIDILKGDKGAGKSAHYLLLLQKADELREDKRGIVIIPAVNLTGNPVFSSLTEDAPTSEEGYKSLWKLYFLSLIGDFLRDESASSPAAKQVIKALKDARLIESDITLQSRLKSVLEYVKAIEVGVSALSDVLPVHARIELGEPTHARANQGFLSVDTLLTKADQALSDIDCNVWILLDRLDAAFPVRSAPANQNETNDTIEARALRSLLRAYLDTSAWDRITPKIFLRSDILRRIIFEEVLPESSHHRDQTILWEKKPLLNLVVRRLVENEVICDLFDVSPDDVLADNDMQRWLFYEVFPERVESGANQLETFDWILSRTTDGASEVPNPREIIHLLNETLDAEKTSLDIGEVPPVYIDGPIFRAESLKSALKPVSKARLEKTIYAEYPLLKRYIEALTGQRFVGDRYEFLPERLASIWETYESDAIRIADQLAEVGVFSKRIEAPARYRLPFLYRDALNIS